MANIVPADAIERIVGARRHPYQHLGRAVSDEQTVYVLHSARCRDSGVDLRECPWSEALDLGIDAGWWQGHEDTAVALGMFRDRLIPLTPAWLSEYRFQPGRSAP